MNKFKRIGSVVDFSTHTVVVETAHIPLERMVTHSLPNH